MRDLSAPPASLTSENSVKAKFAEFYKGEVHDDMKICIAPPQSARAAGEGMLISSGVMYWCTRTQPTRRGRGERA
jgi:hypothetical protein